MGENARECVQFWVNTDLTSNVSVTSEWKLADEDGTLFIADQDRAHFNFKCTESISTQTFPQPDVYQRLKLICFCVKKCPELFDKSTTDSH